MLLPLILHLVDLLNITPSPTSSSGTLQGSAEQRSDNAKLGKDLYQLVRQSCSRNQRGCLEAGAEEELAFQDVQTVAVEQQLEEPEEPEELVQTAEPLARRGSDKDRSHQRTHKCNQRAHQDQSELPHKHDAHLPVLSVNRRLLAVAH